MNSKGMVYIPSLYCSGFLFTGCFDTRDIQKLCILKGCSPFDHATWDYLMSTPCPSYSQFLLSARARFLENRVDTKLVDAELLNIWGK